jgi:hypothetical protein
MCRGSSVNQPADARNAGHKGDIGKQTVGRFPCVWGMPSLSRQWLAGQNSVAYEIATVFSALGEKDQALDWLSRACREHSTGRTLPAVDPRLDGIRAEPRFASLLEARGLGRAK